MTKPTKWSLCPVKTQIKDLAKSLRCPHEEALGPKLPIKHTAKSLIRLGKCPGWSEFAGRTSHFDGFVMWRLRYYSIMGGNNKGADQTVQTHWLICIFVVCIWHKQVLLCGTWLRMFVFELMRSGSVIVEDKICNNIFFSSCAVGIQKWMFPERNHLAEQCPNLQQSDLNL